MSKAKKIGCAYGAGAIGLTTLAIWLAPWGLPAAWPALALAVVAAAYLGAGPVLFGKRNGLLHPVMELVFAPFLQRFQLNAAYDRDIYYSSSPVAVEKQPTRNTYAYDRLRFTLDIDLPFFFVGRLIAGWQRADFQVPFLVDGLPTAREDRLRELRGAPLAPLRSPRPLRGHRPAHHSREHAPRDRLPPLGC